MQRNERELLMALNIQETLDRLVAISEQVVASQSASDGTRTLGKALERSANLVSDNADTLADRSGYSNEEIFALASMLSSLSEVTLPKTATTSWKSDEVQDDIKKMQAAITLDMLTYAQVTLFEGATSVLKSGGGARGPRTEAETIEGKATRVLINNDGNKVADLSGNTAQSPGNIASRLGTLLSVTDKASDEYKALKVYARKACDGETVTIPGTPLALVPFEPED